MITVELDIFSGNPNPFWSLTQEEENELIARVMADPGLTAPPTTVGGLGYRGFSISADGKTRRGLRDAGLPSKFYITSQESVDLELRLLNSKEAGKSTLEEVLEAAKDSIQSTNEIWRQFWITRADGEAVDRPNKSTFEPSEDGLIPETVEDAAVPEACGATVTFSNTDFSFWNDSYSVTRNNCYNFASAYRSHTFAQPGRKSGLSITNLSNCNYTSGYVNYNAAQDGYRSTCWTVNEVYGCLVIWPNVDYHWYRYNTGGYWGHKPGQTPARNYDNSNKLITNPQTCNRGNYSLFCGYRYFPYGWTVS